MTEPTPASGQAKAGAGVPAAFGWPRILGWLSEREDLPGTDARDALACILRGEATAAQIAAFVVALKVKGESADEVNGMVDAMLEAATPLSVAELDPIDIVGTGGAATRRSRALNVSTMASFVAAGAGARVCKHGNRRASSTSGSTDLLEALGASVELDADGVQRCLAETGVAFCFARLFHPAMRHAGPVRAELGIPTVFNILGPLSHPGRLGRAVVGVSDRGRMELVADVFARRNAAHVWVVHGHLGLDELAITGPSEVVEVSDGQRREFVVNPHEVGLSVAGPYEVGGGDAETNAAIFDAILAGAPGPEREIVALNAGAGLVVSGLSADLAAGVAAALDSIDSGRARDAVSAYRSASRDGTAG